MGFGMNDNEWVDPDGDERMCAECPSWAPCPCGCGLGWCSVYGEHTEGMDGC